MLKVTEPFEHVSDNLLYLTPNGQVSPFFFSCYRDREVLLKLKVTLTPKSGIKVWRDFKLLSKEFEHMHLPVWLY